jgi:CDP-glycerol glycerophosphotransferase (TagB/SpsB family)
LGEQSAAIVRLEALIADALAASDHEATADALCELLGSSFGGTPRQSVSRLEMPHVAELAAGVVAALGPLLVDGAARRHGLPVAVRHWLLGLGLAGVGADRVPAGVGDLDVLVGGVRVASLSELTANLELTRFENGGMVIDARVSPTVLFDSPVTFGVEVGDELLPVEVTGEYAGFQLFGHRFADGVHLRAVCPNLSRIGIGEIALRASTQSGGRTLSVRMRLSYGQYSHLARAGRRYWRAGGLKFIARADSVSFSVESAFRLLADEARLILELLKSDRRDDHRAALTRLAYRITRPYYLRNPVWLCHDKMYSAGDCGEYMYHYLEEHREGFVPYFAINADAPEVEGLRARGARLVHPGTLRHRLVYLNAQVVLATHADPAAYNGLDGKAGRDYRDLLSPRIVCIQHGLSMQDIARIMHRSRAGIERYYCASRYEIDNLLKPEYGYRADQLVLTGIPRFDGLHSTPRRRILLAPTWLPELAGAATALNERRPASPDSLDTPFFRIHERVLTDRRLLECAGETGYSIDFALHPYLASNAGALAGHLSDEYGANEPRGPRVRVVVPGIDAPYETLLEEADLMVTDFSGVQYDFAYMGKPVVYFHPDEIPSQYGHGAMDYQTMGFGEVATTVDALVELLCGYMRRDCEIAEVYRARIETFFEYRDDRNCARILSDLVGYLGPS